MLFAHLAALCVSCFIRLCTFEMLLAASTALVLVFMTALVLQSYSLMPSTIDAHAGFFALILGALAPLERSL